jgi:hypothetical protein
VVTTGFARLTDGGKVSISSGDGTPAAQPQGARPRSGQGGGNTRPATQQ